MRKKIFIIAVTVGLLTGGTALASSKENSPVQYLLSAVQILERKLALLDKKLNNIQLTAGPQGPQGEQGLIGPQGITGLQGEQGLPGIMGQPGIQGLQGEKGDKGDIGERGEQGTQGERGIQGIPGPQGTSGPQGPKGDPGEMLPAELKPRLSRYKYICFSQGLVSFKWQLENDFGPIPNLAHPHSSTDDFLSTGISWGTATLTSINFPAPRTENANGYIYQIIFDDISYPTSPQTDSSINFKGNVFWNGFTIPVELNGTWPNDPRGCFNAW